MVVALDRKISNFVDFAFMKEYVKRFLQRITLSSDNGVMLSLLSYGDTTLQLTDFTSDFNLLNKTITDFAYNPTAPRRTDLAIEAITQRFKDYNRQGVPRIAIVFATGLTADGSYPRLRNAAKIAAQENILFMAVSSNKSFAIRDLDAVTNYMPNRIISTDYRPTGVDMSVLMPIFCKCKYNCKTLYDNYSATL